jgi:putative acetyltransferase
MSIRITPYTDDFRGQVIAVWEASVRATHHFLAAADIEFYKAIVENINFNALEMYCYLTDAGTVAGFTGIADEKIEMLFVHPDYMGKGIGKQLLQWALTQSGARFVDVNEDNTKALSFYLKAGFKTTGRTETDDSGKPYPILKMAIL